MVLFILSDLLIRYLPFVERDVSVVAIINGEKILQNEFEREVDKVLISFYNQKEVPENVRQQVRSELWNDILFERVYMPEFGKAGLSVSDDELADAINSFEPNPAVIRLFTDPQTGKLFPQVSDDRGNYSPEKMRALLNFMIQQDPYNFRLRYLEKSIIQDMLVKKYVKLVGASVGYSTREAIMDWNEKSMKKTVWAVRIPYSTIPDTALKISEEDVRNFYEKRIEGPAVYSGEESRDLRYIFLEVVPSMRDSMRVRDSLEGVRIKWQQELIKKGGYAPHIDSEFVMLYNGRFSILTSGDVEGLPDSVILKLDTLSISDVYLTGEGYKIIKVIKTKVAPDSVKARHILLTYEKDSASVEKMADSLISLLKSKKAEFDTLALLYSKDPGSYREGGNLGWFREGVMVQPFNDSCFAKNKGDIFKVRTSFGLHIVEITDRTSPVKKYICGYIVFPVVASSATRDSVYAIISRSYARIVNAKNKYEAFLKESRDMNGRMYPRFNKNMRFLPGIDLLPHIRQWILNARQYDVSPLYELENGYLVIGIEKVHPRKKEPYTNMVEFARDEYTKYLKAKYVAGILDTIKDRERILDILSEKFGVRVDTLVDISFDDFVVPGVGYEPKLIGAIYYIEPGEYTPLIRGQNSLIIGKVISKKEPEPTTDIIVSSIKSRWVATEKSILEGKISDILNSYYGVVDYLNVVY